MTGPDDDIAELVTRLAVRHDVSSELVLRLLGLEREFPDMGVWGAKAGLDRRVRELVTDGLRELDRRLR